MAKKWKDAKNITEARREIPRLTADATSSTLLHPPVDRTVRVRVIAYDLATEVNTSGVRLEGVEGQVEDCEVSLRVTLEGLRNTTSRPVSKEAHDDLMIVDSCNVDVCG